jgi:signal transduction histidine kinase
LTGGIFRKLMAGVVGMFLLALASLEFLHSGILWGVAVAFVAATVLAALLARSLARGFAAVLGDAGETAEKLRKTVEQLQRERSEIERVERVRKDFVINVSHELRTPLASIQGYAETLMDGALNDPQYNMRFLGIIRHNAERLARITQDLLTLSRVEQKRQKFDFEPFSVNGLLKQAIELMRPIAEKREIRLELQPGPADACVWCDSEAVSQILSNLLDNAIKYTHGGAARPFRGIICPRHRNRHFRRGIASRFRTLLSGGQGALARTGRHRPGALHRQTPGRGAQRDHPRGKPRRRRLHLLFHASRG